MEVLVQLMKQIDGHPYERRDCLNQMKRLLRRVEVEAQREALAKKEEARKEKRKKNNNQEKETTNAKNNRAGEIVGEKEKAREKVDPEKEKLMQCSKKPAKEDVTATELLRRLFERDPYAREYRHL